MYTTVHPSHRHVILIYHLVVILDAGETQYARAIRSYRPMSGRSLRLYKGMNTSLYFCNEQPSQATVTPSTEKHAHPPRVVYCAIYPTLTRFTVSSLHISKGGYPITLLPPPTLIPSLALGTTWVRQPRSGSCYHPTAATKCNKQPSQATVTPSVEKHAHPPRVVYCAIYPTLTRFTKSRV